MQHLRFCFGIGCRGRGSGAERARPWMTGWPDAPRSPYTHFRLRASPVASAGGSLRRLRYMDEGMTDRLDARAAQLEFHLRGRRRDIEISPPAPATTTALAGYDGGFSNAVAYGLVCRATEALFMRIDCAPGDARRGRRRGSFRYSSPAGLVSPAMPRQRTPPRPQIFWRAVAFISASFAAPR